MAGGRVERPSRTCYFFGMSDNVSVSDALLFLDDLGFSLPDCIERRLGEYLRLVEALNASLHLTSAGDRERLELHAVDSLSLLPYVSLGKEQGLLDIGSGGGFPALPLLLCGFGKGQLIERSTKKCDFLRMVIARLDLPDVVVVEGEFPRVGKASEACCITARAVERPAKVLGSVLKCLREGAVFLCQMGGDVPSSMFHVEHIDDDWGRRGWRRGELRIVRPIVPRGTTPTL